MCARRPTIIIALWERAECYRYYIGVRREHCDYTQLLDLSLQAPYCESCASWWGTSPDVTSRGWQGDLQWNVGGNIVARTLAAIRWNADYAFRCKRCGTELRPWWGDDLWVETYHLEEHYSIPLEPGRRNPSRKLRDQIIRAGGPWFESTCDHSKIR